MKDIFKEDNSKSETMEERESVRGKLIYYQELIYQNKKKEKRKKVSWKYKKFEMIPVNIIY